MPKKSPAEPSDKCEPSMKVVRHVLADGTVREYRYVRDKKISKKHYPEDSVGGVIEAYQGSADWQIKKELTRSNYRVYLRDLERLRDLPITKLTRSILLSMRDLIAAKRGPGAATVFLRVCSVVLSFAVEREKIPFNPLAGVKKKLGGGHLSAWTEAQADCAAKALPEPLRRIVLLARYTGMRRGDLIALTWSQYDPIARLIKFVPLKGNAGAHRDELVLLVHPALQSELDLWLRQRSSDHVLNDRFGKPWKGGAFLSKTLANGLLKVGLPPGLNVHGLRKLSLTALAEAGCSAHQIAAVSGHTTLDMIELYTRSVNQQKLAREAFERLENAMLTNAPPRKKTA
jgi:integrase